MTLDVTDSLKSAFGSLNTDAGRKVIGLVFALQLVNLGTTLIPTSGAAALVSALVGFGVALVSIAVYVGGFRTFNQGSFEKQQYTENLAWPFLRMTGAQLVTGIFALILAYVPAMLVAMSGVASLSGLSATGLGLAAVGGILAVAAFAWVTLTLVLALPMISIEDNRMFQALDRSVQRTRGYKLRMFLTMLPLAALYILTLGTMVGAQAATVPAAAVVAGAVLSAVTGALFFSLMNEFHERLPE